MIPAATQQALRTLEWIDRAEVLVVCGPTGTGKSHFIEALGHLAIDKGRTVAWHTPETLAHCCAATASTTASTRRSAN